MSYRQDGGERAPGRCRIRRLWQAGRNVPRVRSQVGDRAPGPGSAWVAVTRNGSFVQVIAAHDLDELRAELKKADAEDP
jgi:hypothetical protein